MLDIQDIYSKLENAKLAGNIYQHNNILVLQSPYQDDGTALNVFAQHEHSAEQIGLQFAAQIFEDRIDYLIGVTLSNQDKSYEISAGNLKNEQKAFNLMYTFYNFPKKFYLVRLAIHSTSTNLALAFHQQLFIQPELNFIETTLKTNPHGAQTSWIKTFIIQQSTEMKVRLQIILNENQPKSS